MTFTIYGDNQPKLTYKIPEGTEKKIEWSNFKEVLLSSKRVHLIIQTSSEGGGVVNLYTDSILKNCMTLGSDKKVVVQDDVDIAECWEGSLFD